MRELEEIEYPKTDLEFTKLITHMRLAKLYDGLEEPKMKESHIKEALLITESSSIKAFEKLQSEEALWSFLDTVDKKEVP